MSSLSLRLPDALVDKTNRLAKALMLTKSDYVRMALENYNGLTEQELYRQQLKRSVLEVREQTRPALDELDASMDDGLHDV